MKKLTLKDLEPYDETAYESWVKMPKVKEEVELLVDMGTEDQKKMQAMVDFTNKLLQWLATNDLAMKEYACKKCSRIRIKTGWRKMKSQLLKNSL